MKKSPFTKQKCRIMISGIFLLLVIMAGTSCNKNNDDNSVNIQPKGPKPAWGPDITPAMQTVIEKFDTLTNKTPINDFTPQQARLRPSAADAAMAVQNDYNIATPASTVDTSGVSIPVDGGSAFIHARVYTPRTGKASYPVIVYYHGGGFVVATVDTYNSSAQALAEKVEAVVVSVEYRKAPEFVFPTAHNDAFTAYQWVLANGASIKADTSKIAVAGESAGGNLAANVSLMAKQMGIKTPLHQVLVYPVANNDTTTESMVKYANAEPLSKPALLWFYSYYTPNPSEGDDPRISLVDKANLALMPPTTIIAAELDPLQTEGKLLSDGIAAKGISSTYKLYTGVTHEFFGMNTVLQEAKDAEDFAASQLKSALQ